MYFETKGIDVHYEQIRALADVSIEADESEIVALIGSNGAGKTTTLHAITGLHPPSKGEIWVDGERIDRLGLHEIVRRGVAMVPEGRRVFPYMSVKDNLLMGAFTRRDRAEVSARQDYVLERFPRVRERWGQDAGTLSDGEQQMLVISRALMSNPKLLLLDEPAIGACRELGTGPVLGICEAAMHAATMIAASFSVVTTLPGAVPIVEELTVRYGFERRCRRVRAADLPVLALEEDPQARRRVLAEVGRAVAEDRCEAVILGCAGMADLTELLTRESGVPVIDGVVAAVRLVEALAGGGYQTSKVGAYQPPRAKHVV